PSASRAIPRTIRPATYPLWSSAPVSPKAVTPGQKEKQPPITKMPSAASRDQKERSLPQPIGRRRSGGRLLRRSAARRNTSLRLSATEWAASESSAGDAATTPPTALATAITRLAASATSTVMRVLRSDRVVTEGDCPGRPTAHRADGGKR